MMDCRTFKQRLSEFLDRQLGASEVALAESHLAQCSGCRTEYDDLRSLSRMVGGVGRKPLPVGFMQRLERRRQAEAAPAEKTYYLLPPGLPRAAAFALSSLIVVVFVGGKARELMQPTQGMISGAAGSLDHGSADALSSLGAAGHGQVAPISGLRGETVNVDALVAARGAAASGELKQADSVVPETARLLEAAAKGVAVADKAPQAAPAPAPEKRFKTGSVTSTGQKLAAARGEPVGGSYDGAAAFGGAGGGGLAMKAKADTFSAPATAEAEHAYTNEELAADIERQKKEMGIRKIIQPGSETPPPDILQAMRLTSGPGAVRLETEPSAANLGGDTPRLIAATSRPSPFASRGRVVAQEAPAVPAEKPGPLDEAPGVLLRSETERLDLWHKYEMTAAPPKIDYASQMLAVVFATNPRTSIEITRVTPGADQLVIGFHELPLPAGADRRAAPTYALRVVPKTDKPVVFEKLP